MFIIYSLLNRLRFLRMPTCFAFALWFLFACSGVSFAQSWADNMFTIKSHDFGSVPLLSDTHYSFVFHNTSKQDVHIASVSSSCSCTDAYAPVKTIRSGEKGEIVAKINTSGQHTKKKGATLTVAFDRPSTAYVQLEVAVYIRPDIVLNPGAVDFGAVREGQKITRTVQLQYAGNPNWQLVQIDRANKNRYIHARAEHSKSQTNSREITYNIQITLSEQTPPGYVREILRFITNDKNSPAIELPVSGFVMDPLVAKPSPFQFGSIAPGETVTKYLVLRASQPFRVKSVKCPDDRRFVFSPSDQSSSIHIVAVTLTSKQEDAENIARTVYIETTLSDQGKIQVPVYARFLSAEAANDHEYYAPQWKPQRLELEDPDLAENSLSDSDEMLTVEKKPRPLKPIGGHGGMENLPIDPKALQKIASGEKRNEGTGPLDPTAPASPIDSVDADLETPIEDGAVVPENGDVLSPPQTQNAERKVPPMLSNEYPPEKTVQEEDIAQDWVPLVKNVETSDEIVEEDSPKANEPKADVVNEWRPLGSAKVVQDLPVTKSKPFSVTDISKSPGGAKFGTPQKTAAINESQTQEDAPKKIVGKPAPLKTR